MPGLLRVVLTRDAEEDLVDALRWLGQFGSGVADKWATGLAAKLEHEAELAAATTLRRPRPSDVPESREGHNLLFRSGGRTGSPWHILYEVRDDDGDGSPDTLCVFRIRHAASRGE